MSDRKAVYTVCPRGEGKKDFWLRIGTMWTNRDGSFTITLDALPLSDRLVIRDEQPRDDASGGGNGGGQQRRGNGGGQQPPARSSRRDDFGGQGGGSDDIPF